MDAHAASQLPLDASAGMSDAPTAAAASPAASAAMSATAPGSAKKRKREDDAGEHASEAHARAAAVLPANASAPSAAAAAAASSAASASDGAAAASAAADDSPVPLLIGAPGGEAIRAALTTQHPTPFIQKFQAQHGSGSLPLEASLCFLDLFAPRRAPMYTSLVGELADKLVEQIRVPGRIEKDRMLQLLESSFAYIRVDELRAVPLALLQSLLSSTGSIPGKYLRALVASPPALIESLPLSLRRCLMEAEPVKLFAQHTHWISLLSAYANDAARIEAYNQLLPLEQMAETCKRVRKDPAPSLPGAASAAVSGSNASAAAAPFASAAALHGMLEWIGSSARLYEHTCQQLRQMVLAAERAGRGSDAQVWRSLRVDLLMRLHETQQQQDSRASASGAPAHGHHHHHHSHGHGHGHSKAHLASHIDPLHTWVWCLDAGVRDRGQLSAKLLERLMGSMAETPAPGTAAAATPAAGSAAANTAVAAPAAPNVPGFLSTLKPKHCTPHLLQDLSLLSSHPFIIQSLASSILAALGEAVDKEVTPREIGALRPLTELLGLALRPLSELEGLSVATSSGAASGAQSIRVPEPPRAEELYSEFYPLMAELIIAAQLGEMEPVSPKLLEWISSSAVARTVFLSYLLSRLAAGDLQQAGALLPCLPGLQTSHVGGAQQSGSLWSSEGAQGEQHVVHGFVHSAVSLLLSSVRHALKTSAPLRASVFTRCFIPLARASPLAHREAVRLLAGCVDCLTVEETSGFLTALQREGKRGNTPPTPPAAAPAPTAAATADAATPSAAPAPSASLSAQIAAQYKLFQAAHPQFFKDRAKKPTAA